MSKSILELAKEAREVQLKKAFPEAENSLQLAEKAEQSEKILRELMRGDGKAKAVPHLNMKEAVFSADFKILFPKVVQDVLQRPKEGPYIGQSLLSRTIQVDGVKIMEFPTLGAIRAFELADSQEPPEQDPSFSKNITEIRVRRFGVKLEISNEVLDESQWDILSLYTEAAGAAMMRKKEELIFSEYEQRAVTIFDNSLASSVYHTSGVNQSQAKNATFDHLDLLDMMAALGANNYVPTDVILHPMAWSIWAKDPFLRYQLLHRGNVGQTVGAYPQGGDFNANPAGIQVYVPFGLNVVVSPFQTISYNANPNTGIATGGTYHYTSITVVDRNSSILVLQRTPMSVVTWDNPIRDIQSMAFHEKYGLALLNGGRSAVVAKNIRLDENFAPAYTVRQVS